MSNNIDLKELWNKQEIKIPETKELFEKAANFKKKNIYKIIFINIALLMTSAFIISIWYYFQPESVTTKIGIVFIILAMVLYLIVYNRMIPLLLNVGYDLNSNQYLQQLLKLKEKQRFLQNTILNIYFILLSTGIFLYMMEYTSRMNVIGAILTYGITFIWIGINWFYFRPKSIKKQEDKINKLIDRFKLLSNQLEQL